MAIRVGKRTFGGGTDMGENEVRSRLRADTEKVDAVPGWSSRGEDTWGGTQGGRSVIA